LSPYRIRGAHDPFEIDSDETYLDV
jgi:hypothetical protein